MNLQKYGKIIEFVRVVFIIVLVIGGLWFVSYLIDSHYQQRDKERFKLFQKATEDCYKRERSCDAIFENLYEDLFPQLGSSYD